MEHTKHLWRAGLLVVAFGFVLLIARHFAVPDTFGDEGYFRAASRIEFMTQPIVHGGPGSCAECHEQEHSLHASGKHAKVSCETCHAPLTDHVRDGEVIRGKDGEGNDIKMPANPSQRLCNICHLKLVARPAAFPQIVPLEHLLAEEVIDPGDPVPDGSCVLCHSVHKPDVEN